MKKTKLSADQYIEKLNQRLKQDEMYEEGMAFIPHPPRSAGAQMSGYSVTGPTSKLGEYARVAHQVNQEFEI